jgi:3-dehydroquinate synthase
VTPAVPTAGQPETTTEGTTEATTIHVGTDYDVLVGSNLLGRVPELLGESVERVMLVHSAAVRPLAETVGASLRGAGRTAYLELVPDGERAKTADVAMRLWGALGRAGFTRSDAVVGIGGGTVTDVAGFVAATWLRGVPVLQVPTTLLGMVDAAVGGKTGINTPEGKNLVGSFHPPAGVLCDLDVLAGLPERDTVAGLAEVVKCGFVADPEILDLVEDDPAGLGRPGHRHLRELVERSVRVKADVVAADLRESSLREILNYGHTFGHAVEQVEGFTMRHGEAVSIGMVFVAELARLAGRLDPAVVDRHRTVLAGLGLPVGYRGDRWPDLLAAMRRDKKARGSVLRFVILEELGRPARLEGPEEALLRSAYAAVATS